MTEDDINHLATLNKLVVEGKKLTLGQAKLHAHLKILQMILSVHQPQVLLSKLGYYPTTVFFRALILSLHLILFSKFYSFGGSSPISNQFPR